MEQHQDDILPIDERSKETGDVPPTEQVQLIERVEGSSGSSSSGSDDSSSGSDDSSSGSDSSSGDSSSGSDDDSSSDEEEEGEVAVPKRKAAAAKEGSKKKKFRFLDVEADVGSGDDEDEEFIDDEGALREAREGGGRESRELELLRREAEQRRKTGGNNRLQSVIQRLEERAAKEKAGEVLAEEENTLVPVDDGGDLGEFDDGEFQTAAAASAALFPRSDDHKLFFVRMAEPGKEKEAVIQLSHKAAAEIAEGKDCPIRSVFSVDSLRGYIYIEAPSESAAKNFLSGIRKVQSYSVTVVPQNEMVGVLRTALDDSLSKFRPLQPGEFVRIKRNQLYKGDLARVIESYDRDVELELVPRIDWSGFSNAKRPAPSLFDEQTLGSLGLSFERLRNPGSGAVRTSFRGELFSDEGFLVKRFSRASLVVGEEVGATSVEIRRFSAKSSDTLPDDFVKAPTALVPTSSSQTPKPKQSSTISVNDTVIVKSGDTRNLVGRVTLVDRQNGIITLEAKSVGSLQVVARDVEKFFSISDHVRVMSGQSAGDTGIVTAVTLASNGDRTHAVLVDGETREVIVPAMLLERTPEVSKGETQFGGFSLGDLVQVRKPADLVGLVVRIAKSGQFSVLGVDGKRVFVNIADLAGRKDARAAFALTKHGDAVRRGSVVSGSFGSANVAEVHRNTLFVKVNSRTEDAGFLACQANDVELVSTSRVMGGSNIAGGGGASAAPAPSSGGGWRRGAGKLEGKRVRIIRGPFKGNLAQVREDHDTRVQVSLEAKFRVVTIPKDCVRLEDEADPEPQTGQMGDLNNPPMGSLSEPPQGYVPPSSVPFTPAPPHW